MDYRHDYSLASTDNAATTRKAMPVQNRSPPVRKYTTMATRTAGINTKNSLMRTMIIKPMITKMTSTVRSSPKLPRIERTIGHKNRIIQQNPSQKLCSK